MSPQGRVSAIIPARNEEVNIARVVRSLAHQQDLREILVVDDQSTDRTREILASLEREIPSLRALRVESLPAGWLGKTYAAAHGAREATGEWFLFTDADTEHLKGSLVTLLLRAEVAHADLLSLSPGQETPTWWEKAVIPLVYVQLASLYRFEDVSDPLSPVAAANGQYLLVRRETYERSGGHQAVREAILEDVELARRIKLLGGKLLFLPGAEWVRTRMYQTFREMWRGWTKNLFLLYEGEIPRMLTAVASLWLLDVIPALAFVAASLWSGLGHRGGLAVLIMLGFFLLLLMREWRYGQKLAGLGFEPALATYRPVGAALLGALLLASLRAHRGARNIEWKGRHYATKGTE